MSENVISVEELRQTIDANYIQDVSTVWHGLHVEIKKHLSMQDTINFVESVVTLCFAADTDEYVPEIKDYAIRRMILEYYTNFTLPDEADEQFELVYSSELISFITEHIDRAPFEAMLAAIDSKVEYLAQSHVNALTKQVDEVMKGFENLEKSMSDLFGGVDADTIMQIAGAVVGSGFDEEKLAQAAFALNNKEDNTEDGEE